MEAFATAPVMRRITYRTTHRFTMFALTYLLNYILKKKKYHANNKSPGQQSHPGLTHIYCFDLLYFPLINTRGMLFADLHFQP